MARRSLRVIINADDLGWSPEISDAILSLVEAHRVTSASIMANGPHFEETVARIGDLADASFGVHLNLTQGLPCGDGRYLGGLLDAAGSFHKFPRSMWFSATMLAGIYAEFDAQIRRLIAHGVKISHIDSHHHVHTIPALFPIIKRLQLSHCIRRVRISQNIFPIGHASAAKQIAKYCYNWSLANAYRTLVTGGFSEFMIFYDAMKNGGVPYDLVEAMVHPGPASHAEETELLWTDWWIELDADVELITWECV